MPLWRWLKVSTVAVLQVKGGKRVSVEVVKRVINYFDNTCELWFFTLFSGVDWLQQSL